MELTNPPAQFIFPLLSVFCSCNICVYQNLHSLTVHIFLSLFVSSADITVLKGQKSSSALRLFHEINRTDLYCLSTLCVLILTSLHVICPLTCYRTRGSVRNTRGLGPTMTTRGQSIGISIGMLLQTLIMSITVQKTSKYYTTEFDLEEGF